MESVFTTPMPILEIKTPKGDQLIVPLEILYVKADNKHSILYLTNLNSVYTNHQLKWYEEKLPEPLFCRCHNSYIVNCLYITCTCGNRAILKANNTNVPISRDKMRYYKDNLALFKQHQALHLLQNKTIHPNNMPVTPR